MEKVDFGNSKSKITVAIGFFTENIREPFAEIKTGKDYPETFQ